MRRQRGARWWAPYERRGMQPSTGYRGRVWGGWVERATGPDTTAHRHPSSHSSLRTTLTLSTHAASHCPEVCGCPNNHRVPRTARPRAAVIVGTRLRPTFPLKQQRRSHLEAPRRRHQRETRTYDSHLPFGDPAARRVQPASNAPLRAAGSTSASASEMEVARCTVLPAVGAISWSKVMSYDAGHTQKALQTCA